MQTDAFTALARNKLDALDAAIAGLLEIIDTSTRAEVTAFHVLRDQAEWLRGWLVPPG